MMYPCLQVGERQAFDLGFEEEKTGSYLPSERSDSQAGGKGSSTKLGSTGAHQDSLAVGGGCLQGLRDPSYCPEQRREACAELPSTAGRVLWATG